MDATVKQLLRHALPALLDVGSPQAAEKLETFAVSRVNVDADPRTLARYIAASNPRDALIEDYVYDLTCSSLQSSEQMGNAVGALGVSDKDLRRDINALKVPFLKARNRVAHELDLSHPERPGDRSRAGRGTTETVDMCHQALDVTQRLINEVSALLGATGTAEAGQPRKDSAKAAARRLPGKAVAEKTTAKRTTA